MVDSTTTATGATGSTEQPVPEEPTDGAAAAGDTNEPLVPVERGPQRPYTFPITSLAWGIYALSLCVKIWILFRNNVPQNLSKDAGFGPHVFRFGIGLATFVFSLLVLGQKVIRGTFEDDTRNDYLHNLCFRVALEILDSVGCCFILTRMPKCGTFDDECLFAGKFCYPHHALRVSFDGPVWPGKFRPALGFHQSLLAMCVVV